MSAVWDAFWRATVTGLHPRLLLWTLLPLVLAGGALGALAWFWWDEALAAVRGTLERLDLLTMLLDRLAANGANQLRAFLAPLVLVMVALPLVIVASLLLVGLVLSPVVVELVARRRFAGLERKRGAGWAQCLGWSLACTLAALLALAVSVPLWFVLPLAVLLPPLVWGWLTYRVLAFDALAGHASPAERRTVLRTRRWPLLGMGIACGWLGALPALLWALGTATLIFAPFLLVASVWLYTLVFAFAACWFTHYALAELQALRTKDITA